MQGKHSRLCAEAEEDADPRDPQLDRMELALHGGRKLREKERFGDAVKIGDTEEKEKSPEHGHRKIGRRGGNCLFGLLMHHQKHRRKGEDFKKAEAGQQIRRIEHAHGGTEGEQEEKAVPWQMLPFTEIPGGEDRRHGKQEGADAAVESRGKNPP